MLAMEEACFLFLRPPVGACLLSQPWVVGVMLVRGCLAHVLDEKATGAVVQHPSGTTKGGQPLGRPERAARRHGSCFKRKRPLHASRAGDLGTNYGTAGQIQQ